MPINFDLKKIREKYGLKTFFETGLFKGKSVTKALDAGFSKAVSIEISTIWFTVGQETFEDEISDGSVVLIHDDSKNLAEHLHHREGNTFFWLDAHADQTSQHEAGHRCPLYHELEAIREIIRPGDVIAIDDIRIIKGCSWGSNVTYQKLLETVNEIGDYDIKFLDGVTDGDVLVAFPV